MTFSLAAAGWIQIRLHEGAPSEQVWTPSVLLSGLRPLGTLPEGRPVSQHLRGNREEGGGVTTAEPTNRDTQMHSDVCKDLTDRQVESSDARHVG